MQDNFKYQEQIFQSAYVALRDEQALGAIALKNAQTKLTDQISNRKLTWLNYESGAFTSAVKVKVAQGYFSDNPQVLELESTEFIIERDHLKFQTKDRKEKPSLILMVTEKIDANKVKCIKISTADTILEKGDIAIVNMNARPKGADLFTPRDLTQGKILYNNTQIIDSSRFISGSDGVDKIYTNEKDILTDLRVQNTLEFARKLNNITSSDARHSYTYKNETITTAGGLPFFAENLFDADGNVVGPSVSNKKDLQGGVITTDDTQYATSHAREHGGYLNAVIASPAMYAMLASLSNNQVVVPINSGTMAGRVGGSILEIRSSIPGMPSITNFYIDTEMPRNKIIFLNDKSVSLVWMKNRKLIENFNAPQNGNDKYIHHLLGEYTFYCENPIGNTFVFNNVGS